MHACLGRTALRRSILSFAAMCLALCVLAGCTPAEEPQSSSAPAAESSAVAVEDKGAASQVASASASTSASVSSASSQTDIEPVHSADAAIDAAVQEKLAAMTLEEKVAQLFIAFPESLCSDGTTLSYVDDDVRSNLGAYPVGGLCLLEPNLEDEVQTRALLADLQAAAQADGGLPLLLCVDEEGGTVARVGSNPAFSQQDAGDMRAIGDAGDANVARDAAKTMGSYLFDLGFNVDFAPVADVDTPEATTMEERSFGTDPQLVARMVSAQVEGFASAGVLCSAKHFPGIGSASGDSHEQGIVLDKSAAQLETEDLVPFKAAIDAGVPMVMVGHISCPQVTGDSTPATFSSAIMEGLLRDQLGFEGVIVTDGLNMGAATEAYSGPDACVQAFAAGADMLLLPTDLAASHAAMLDAVRAGTISEARLDQSVARILIMKLKYEKATADQRKAASDKAAEEARKAEEEVRKAEEEAARKAKEEAKQAEGEAADAESGTVGSSASGQSESVGSTAAATANLAIAEDYRASFVHGDKGAADQKYIMLHDTEGDSDAYGTINYWDSSGQGVAAHFIVNKDGSVVQCVPLDKITHHAGFGDAGHNALYGVEDESRDDKVGTVPIGDWAPDYGMNSYSVGIEMVHVGGSGDYPEAQLQALDALIAYIDSYYGFESAIIDHKAWRTGNSDTSPEFAQYLANYQDHRTHY